MKKSPVGSWRSFFNLGKSSSVSKRKLQRNESEPSEMKAMALKGQCPPAVPELPLGEGGRSVHTFHSVRAALSYSGRGLSVWFRCAPVGCSRVVLLHVNCLLLPTLYPRYKN